MARKETPRKAPFEVTFDGKKLQLKVRGPFQIFEAGKRDPIMKAEGPWEIEVIPGGKGSKGK